MAKRKHPPAEKKRLSYERDRRNTWRENSKATRKAIPKFKAASNRTLRRRGKQLADPKALEDGKTVEGVEARIADETWEGLHPIKRKCADVPLGFKLAEKGKLPPSKPLPKRDLPQSVWWRRHLKAQRDKS